MRRRLTLVLVMLVALSLAVAVTTLIETPQTCSLKFPTS